MTIDKYMKRAISKTILVCLAAALIPAYSVAADGDWEIKLKASTPQKARNNIFLGQRADATDWYDSKYDGDAMLDGDIRAYFPHPEWGRTNPNYWRDIMGTGDSKTWTVKVESAMAGEMITLSWVSSTLPAGYSVTLTDKSTNQTTDMSRLDSYSYGNSGPREFTVQTLKLQVAPAPVEPTTPPAETTTPVEQIHYYTVSGKVTGLRGEAMSGVAISISTSPVTKTKTDASGNYVLPNIPSGSYTVTPSLSTRSGTLFSPGKRDVTVESVDLSGVNFKVRTRR